MKRAKLLAAFTAIAAALFCGSTAHAKGWRAGRGELFFGLGSLSSEQVSVDGFSSLDADDGTTFDVRFQFHFNENLGIQVEGMGESERTTVRTPGFFPLSDDTTTRFFLVNALFNLTEGPISPFVAVGVGNFRHRNSGAGIDENGSAFDAAVGFEGQTRGPLVWAVEVRYLYYEFSDFQDAWNRYQYSGHLGFRF